MWAVGNKLNLCKTEQLGVRNATYITFISLGAELLVKLFNDTGKFRGGCILVYIKCCCYDISIRFSHFYVAFESWIESFDWFVREY